VNSTRLNTLAGKARRPVQKTWSFASASSIGLSSPGGLTSPNGSTRKLSVASTDISEMDVDHLYAELGLKPVFNAARRALDGLYEEEMTTEKRPKPGKKFWWAVKGVSYFGMSFASILVMFYLLRL
jgi:hypothetical protein